MCIELLSDDLIGRVADCLNPKDQRVLASCNLRFREVLPGPLRIRISKLIPESGSVGVLGGEWFVSRINVISNGSPVPPERDTSNESASSSQEAKRVDFEVAHPPLDEAATLAYNTPYVFWRFDYREECPVYLGRHLRQTLRDTSPMQYRYTLGLRPHKANQYWKVLSPENSEGDATGNGADANAAREISWKQSDVKFIVAGFDNRSGQPDSTEEHRLMAHTRTRHEGGDAWTWHAAKDEPPASNSTIYSIFQLQQISARHPSSVPKSCRRWPSSHNSNEVKYQVATQAIPDICDKGAYLLYSPRKWESHLSPCHSHQSPGLSSRRSLATPSNPTNQNNDGRSAVIEFSFWVASGVLHFKAHLLPFTLAVPIMQLDRKYFEKDLGPITNLFESYSARWGCIKYYMATAADVGEGCVLNMGIFLRGVTDHDEHAVNYDTRTEVVSISMHDTVDTEIPDLERDDSQIWRFFFSW